MGGNLMPKLPIPFVGTAYKMPAIQLDNQNCVNWYLVNDQTGKFNTSLSPRPGLELWADDSNNKSVRGMFELNDVLYTVIDNSFRIYNNNGNYQEKGTLKTSFGNVRMIANDEQIFITDGRFGYVYQLVKSATRKKEEFFIIEEASSAIQDPPDFFGAGLDDMSTGGTYIGSTSKTYRVEIDSVGSGDTPDTFRWSDSDGDTWNAEGIQITANDQNLNDGVTIQFIHKTGHTLKDYWKFDATTDSAFYVPIIPAYQDNYGIYAKQVSTVWYISEINDFSVVNALDFAKTSAFPDDIVAAVSIREEIWFLGKATSEIWYNAGEEAFPFRRRTNLIMNYGCAAPYSLTFGHNNILFWLAVNRDGGFVVVAAAEYNIKIISTEAINAELRTYSRIDDAIGWITQWDGHIFYILTFPEADKTWAFDLTTNSWGEWSSRYLSEVPSDNQYINGRWLANNYVFYNGKGLVGDYKSGKIYKLSRNNYTDNGETIIWERTTRVLQENLNRICVYSLILDFEKGKGLTIGQGDKPALMLKISRDGGITWGRELWRTSGEIGRYQERIKWNRLGVARSYVFRIRVTDPVYNVLLGAVAEIEDTGS
jgi:hypothetical protein